MEINFELDDEDWIRYDEELSVLEIKPESAEVGEFEFKVILSDGDSEYEMSLNVYINEEEVDIQLSGGQ